MSDHSPSAYLAGALVRYRGATATLGSRWIATIDRGGSYRVRVTVPYADGPDTAAVAVVDRFNAAAGTHWQVLGSALSLDNGAYYTYPVGPTGCDRDGTALDAVAALLNAADWSSDHLNAVADMVRATGRTIEDLS